MIGKKADYYASQFIDGFDQNTIIDVTNSFNTFQNYTHYTVEYTKHKYSYYKKWKLSYYQS